MYSLLLAVIYLAFIALGLPDALLGSAWTVMRAELNVPLSYAGIIFGIISAGTIVSSLTSDRLTKKFGVALTATFSVLLTAVSLLGFGFAKNFITLCVLAVPYGLGAGAVDAALNNYVALHYKSRHMNWLHCFWGVGATISPYIMSMALTSAALTSGSGWQSGYKNVAIIQFILTAIMFIALPLWKKQAWQNGVNQEALNGENKGEEVSEFSENKAVLKLSQIVKIKGVKFILPAFFAYCALEQTAGLWASSFLVIRKGADPEIAAKYASFFFLGITAGRFLCGFVANKIGDKNMLRIGAMITIIGIVAVWLPGAPNFVCLNGLIVIGLGNAPIYPSIIHATPANFGKANSQAVIGVQMASAYLGITLMPPLFGVIAQNINISLYPLYLLMLALSMFILTEKMNKVLKNK